MHDRCSRLGKNSRKAICIGCKMTTMPHPELCIIRDKEVDKAWWVSFLRGSQPIELIPYAPSSWHKACSDDHCVMIHSATMSTREIASRDFRLFSSVRTDFNSCWASIKSEKLPPNVFLWQGLGWHSQIFKQIRDEFYHRGPVRHYPLLLYPCPHSDNGNGMASHCR